MTSVSVAGHIKVSHSVNEDVGRTYIHAYLDSSSFSLQMISKRPQSQVVTLDISFLFNGGSVVLAFEL